MHTTLILASVAVATGLVDASPAVPGAKTFRVDQVAHGKTLKSGPIEIMKTFDKYAMHGAVAPPEVVDAIEVAKKQQGTTSADPLANDALYISPVTIGGQKLNLDFDTGSSDLWVFSTLQPSSEINGQAAYNPTKSTTAKKLPGYSWNITYGDGSGASGVVYADRVVIGGVTATSQAVEAATSVSRTFTSNSNDDGLLGLAFSTINTVKPKSQTTFFDTVSATLKKKVFTADLKYQAPGSYDFGFVDASKHEGAITYVPVDNSNGFWQIKAGQFAYGTSATSNVNKASRTTIGTSIVDTGTSLVYLPAAFVKQYYSSVRNAKFSNTYGGYVFPCTATLPSAGVGVGGKLFVIPSDYINFAPVNKQKKTCFGGLQPNTGIGFSILGDIFLKSVFAVFDQSQGVPRVGFADKTL